MREKELRKMALAIGEKAQIEKKITEEDLLEYARMTGDYNPIHVDEEEAKKTVFGGRIAHGVLPLGMISAVLGTKMPGYGTIFLGQTVNYKLPVRIGDTVRAICEVSEILNEAKGIYRIRTYCLNQNDETVLDGDAVVKYTE